jgi:hypothetical protein
MTHNAIGAGLPGSFTGTPLTDGVRRLPLLVPVGRAH